MAVQTFKVTGEFWEPFELENYPFDVRCPVFEQRASALALE
jgi:hypothetical protein